MMSQVPGKFVLTSDVPIQTRRAQAVDAQLAEALRSTCKGNRHIAACYLLDGRRPDTGEVALFIAVTLDDEVAHMDAVAQQFQAMLQRFPTQASKTLIMSSAQFAQEHAGAEFHVRRTRRGRRTLALVLSPLALSFLWCAFVDQEPFGAFVLGLLFTVLFGAIALGAWLVRRFGEKRLKETVP